MSLVQSGVADMVITGGKVYTITLYTAGFTLPLWAPSLSDWSEIAGQITPLVVLGLLVMQFYAAWKAGRDAESRAEKLMNIAQHSRTGGIVAVLVLIITGLLRLFRRPAPVATTTKPTKPKPGATATPLPAPPAPSKAKGWLSWFELAKAEIGTLEGAGKGNNPRVVQYYADAGFAGVKSDDVAWCAAFANAMLVRAGFPGTASLAARSFLTWGKTVAKPYPGCVVVFKRGDSAWQGHVAFYVGETATHIKVLGGNQSDKVSIANYPRSKLLGYREPMTMGNSRTVQLASVMTAVAAVPVGLISIDLVTTIFAVGSKIEGLADTLPYAALVGGLVTILGHILQVWIRIDDNARKGGK
jgi:uncharacterized protein (TIGR02594 family)